MHNISVATFDQPDLDNLLETDERLLWSGFPGYGRQFSEFVGHERTTHIAAFVGLLVMWSTLPFIETKAEFGRFEAVWLYGVVSVIFFSYSLYLASQRQYVLLNLVYFITDRRVIICRRGRNWRLAARLYVISCPHSNTYPYSLIPGRPYPSLQVGTLLSVNQVQPFGWGLSHPGHSILRDRITSMITLDYIPDAQAVLEIIQSDACQK